MNNQPTPRQVASWAKAFVKTPFGKYFMEIWKDAAKNGVQFAMFKAPTTDSKVMHLQHAAGITEIMEWIERYQEMTEEQLKEMEGEE